MDSNLSIWEVPFQVIDVETTGSNSENNRIIEIACVTLKGGEIVSTYSSLVNPHQWIPVFISQMTGITYDMVIEAPEGEDVFPEISKLLSEANSIFVAHNVRFDLSFVNHAFLRLDYKPLELPILCTLKLARRILPANIKKNVGALSQHYGIDIDNRHRALDDAYATALVLNELLKSAEETHGISNIGELIKFQNKQISQVKKPTAVQTRLSSRIAELPDQPGVYYFLDKTDKILYVGKAKSLKDRVRTYFHQESYSTRKIANMLKKAHDLVWETTETELGALLLESREIKRLQPPFNVVDKIYKDYRFIKINLDDIFPRLEMTDAIENDNAEYYGPFKSSYLVQDIIKTIERRFKLRKCDLLLRADTDKPPCFYHHIDMCLGPCSGQVTPSAYMEELRSVRYFLSGYSQGIIEQLESKMQKLAEKLDFEKALQLRNSIRELRKVFDRKNTVPTSINKNTFVLVIPANPREKTAEIFLIKSGILHHQLTIGRKAPMAELFEKIDELYFPAVEENLNYGKEDIDELKIITSWIYKQNNKGMYIYIDDREKSLVFDDIESTVRSLFTSDNASEESTEDDYDFS